MSDGILERLYRRVMMATGLARITTGKDDGATQVLQLDFGVNEVQDNRFRLAEYGFTSMPKSGADAFVAFLGGDRSAGVVIATGDRRFRLKGLKSGEVALYDDKGQVVHLTRDGIVIGRTGNPITLDAPNVRTTGNLSVATGATGTFTARGGQTITVQDGIITNIY